MAEREPMADTPFRPTPVRLQWMDGVRGIAILWIVFFHALIAYDGGRFPWPLGLENFSSYLASCPGGLLWRASCLMEGLAAGTIQRGPHAVGVFILLSGFGLTYSLSRTGQRGDRWFPWYGRRLARLFPLYWVAHGVYLVSPFILEHHPVDHRMWLSLLGNRVFPVDAMFYYLVPAWWYFGLLLQLLLVFPLLHAALVRWGPARFLLGAALVTLGSRYALQHVLQAHGNYMQGAFFGARLWEFGAGMALAVWFRTHPGLVQERLFSSGGLGWGVVVYAAGVFSYRPGITSIMSDALTAMGLFVVLAHVARAMARLPRMNRVVQLAGFYSYGIYLLHQPYVMFWARELTPVGFWLFLLSMTGVVSLVCLLSMGLEWLTSRCMTWIPPPGPRSELS